MNRVLQRLLELGPVAHVRALASSWHGRVILLVVVGGLALPIHYYMPAHRDPHDERYAWRMFSPMRMAKCDAKVTKNGAPLDPYTEFHEAWVTLAKRGRFHVIERMGEHLCAKYPHTDITFDLTCKYLDDTTEHYGGFNMCTVPYL
ncbi:MAG: hypothetical protein KF773_09305 [Deltaproteobacteria bacterium]|nr:hypothetical protein [Deltaproteobacteria bacterium]